MLAQIGRGLSEKTIGIQTDVIFQRRCHRPVQQSRRAPRRGPHLNTPDGISYVPEDRRIFSGVTLWEDLDVAYLPLRMGGRGLDKEWAYELVPDLAWFSERKGGLLSAGQQLNLTIARTLTSSADLLLLDEPSKDFAPLIVVNIFEKHPNVERSWTVRRAGGTESAIGSVSQRPVLHPGKKRRRLLRNSGRALRQWRRP
ncbi:ATP-binding cassette domain-containing protein [Bradyrhizobium sp. 190]|uniref:ATP-binding cassette domain-containing protein n=1 Tax=Bradyrhizobium sp. 190 TaxID=2782658 RepID=UPI001FFAB474|nr:ATP-binding cassette domain-containing protein [Bradyrhizobium sp. 190]MCK1513222.1 ATP-binding cassette domain-containing protein [Bradyrhizobium sp. 190]